MAPYHHRQVVVLKPKVYVGLLSGATPATEICRPLPPGTLSVGQVR
jgi:putative SOS response-associated peptidase YedK